MAKFKKQILQVGTYQSPDGEVKVTPERLTHWQQTFSKMSTNKIGIPVSWDHDDDPNKSVPYDPSIKVPQILTSPAKRRRRAQGTVGYMSDFSVADDGNSASITLDIPDKRDASKVKNNLAYFSPVIYENWKDGRGTDYADCITHGDLVQHPVDNSQSQFTPAEPASVACALRMGLDTGKPTIYRLGEKMEDDDKKEDVTEDSSTDDVEEAAVAVDNDSRMSDVLDSLAGMDIVLSEDTNEENFLQHLHQALLTAAAQTGDIGASDDAPLEEATPEFAALSLERKYMDKQHQQGVIRRLSALLEDGRCTPHEVKQHKPNVSSVRLSLDDQGEHKPSKLEVWIESRESVPKGTFWDASKRTRMGQLEEVSHPSDMLDPESEEATDKLVDDLFKR